MQIPIYFGKIETLIETRNLFPIIQCEEAQPMDAKALATLKANNAKTRYYIIRTIHKHVKSYTITHKTSNKMFKTFSKIY